MSSPPVAWTQDQVKRFWDHASRSPESYASFLVGRNIARRISRLLAKSRQVLDFGCGPGFLIPYLAEQGPTASGCELSADSAAAAHARLAGTPRFGGVFPTADLLAAGKTYDLITCVEVIEHLDDKALDHAFAAIKALLGPSGILVLTTPNDEDLAQSEVVCPNCQASFHRWQHVRSWTAATLAAFLARQGLKVITIAEDDFAFPPGLIWRIARLARDRIAGRRKRPQLLALARS